jgi:polymorphic membrane protein
MADRIRRVALAAIALPVLFLAMSGLASASTLTVTNTNDTGMGSLRAEILAASSGDTINFNVSGTITLGSTLPAIAIDLTIDGSGQAITVDGKNSFQILSVNSGATLTLHNLTIAKGSIEALPDEGGGILNHGTLTVTNSTFTDNNAPAFGGGIENDGTLTVTDSTFSGNRVEHEGGGIHNTGTLTVSNSTFFGNEADGDIGGGAILNDIGATLKVTNSTFFDNSAPFATLGGGGGIFNSGTLTVTNSTFSDNSATDIGGGVGGGIDNEGTLTVTNCTFSGNSAGLGGGGIGNLPLGSTTLKGTILAAEPGGNCGGVITDAGYNISDDVSCPLASGTSVDGSTTLNLDPLGLTNNGGPTQTIALEPNSEAVDFIPVASCKDQEAIPQPLTTDQRGFPRPDSGNLAACDAGAFELQTGRLAVVSGSERTQIARSTSGTSDQVNMAFTFFDNGSPILDDPPSIVGPHCDDGTDALNGIDVDLFEGTCASLSTATGGLLLDLSPFVVHTVNHESYGTLFQSSPTVPSPETVSARIVQLPTPKGTCGEWTLNIEVAGLDTAAIGLGGGNPFALVIEDGDKNVGCFDITNAIVGSQTPRPPHGVRRRVRRR